MIDIKPKSGEDMVLYNTDVYRATNILSVQIGSLEYAPLLGIDLNYFLSEDFSFQNDSFKSYLIQTLANNGVNVASVIETIETLITNYTFNLSPQQTNGGLIAR